MNNEIETKIEAKVFKRLIEHLQNRTDVQNIDLMNLSGFCRNCLSRWYSEAAQEDGLDITKEKYQNEASEDQKDKFQTSIAKDH